MIKKIKIFSLSIMVTMLFLSTTLVNAASITYTPLDVPNINSSFKTWMNYKLIAKGSPQRNFIDKWGWVDSEGFMRCNGENDFGIYQDYYLVAMGSYYGKDIGTKYRITTDTGNVFYVALSEFKADIHTNSTHQYCPGNKDILEFLVNPSYLNSDVRRMGSANVYMPLNGSIISIERMDFIY